MTWRNATRRAILASLLVVCAVVVSAPALALDPSRAITDHVARVWDTKHGLPQATVYAIEQTRDGYLWLGTEEGLVRFDGVRFVVFNRANTPELRSNLVRRLHEDRAGYLWIAPRGGGLVRLRDGVFTAFSAADGLPSDTVWSIFERADGGLVFGTQQGARDGKFFGGLTCFDGARFRNCGFNASGGERTLGALWIDPDGTTWLGGATDGLARMKDGVTTIFTTNDGLSDDGVLSLLRDRRGTLWIGTSDGKLNAYDGKRFTAYPVAQTATDHVLTIAEDKDENLWLGTRESGLVRFKDGRWAARTTTDGMPSSQVFSVFEDREGNLWAGTMTGLVRLRDAAFTNEDHVGPARTPSLVWSVREDRAGALWLATQQYGLQVRRAGATSWTTYTAKQGLSADDVFGLEEDPDGSIWTGSHFGLNHLKDGAVTVYSTKDGLPSNDVVAITRDRHHRLWVGTWGGLSLLQPEKGAFRSWTTRDGLGSAFIITMLEGKDDLLWIGTDGGGLSALRDGKLATYGKEDGLSDNLVYALHEDERGTLWIGTMSGGLNRMQDGKLTHVTTKDGLFNDSIYSILEDDRHDLWMGCGRGVFRVARSELDDFLDGKIKAVTSIAYDEADGMKRSECNYGSAVAAKGRDGRLHFATGAGAAVVDPARIPRNPSAPPVLLEELLVNRTPVPIAEGLRLPAGSREFELRYTGLSLTSLERVRFRYRLDGFERAGDWIDAGARRVAYYTNLAPGSYRFRVIAANSDGVWNETGATFGFSIAPRFYQTNPFYAAVLAAIALFGLGGHRLRVRQLSARARELQQRVDERTSEIVERSAELARAFRTLEEKDALLHEDLSQARAFQQSLLPELPKASDLVFAAQYKPTAVVGGDIYDVSEIAPGRFRIFLADTTGHGVQASMRTMVLQTEYTRWKRTAAGPAELLFELNRALVRSFPKLELRCTACCFDVVVSHGEAAPEWTVRYANAGQLPLLVARAGVSEVTELYLRGSYLGMIEDAAFDESELRIARGDRVLAFTDGLVEQEDLAGAEFGIDPLRVALSRRDAPLDALLSAVVEGLERHAGARGIVDDVTIVGVEAR